MSKYYTPQFKENAIDEFIKRSSFNNIAEYIAEHGYRQFIVNRNKFYNEFSREVFGFEKENRPAQGKRKTVIRSKYFQNDKLKIALEQVIESIKEFPTLKISAVMKETKFHKSYFNIGIKFGYFKNLGNNRSQNWVVLEDNAVMMLANIRKEIRERKVITRQYAEKRKK